MEWKKGLQNLATAIKPEYIPPSIRVAFTERTIAVFDKYPKAKYHILLLPRPQSYVWTTSRLISLRSVLRYEKEVAKELLLLLQRESEPVVRMIEDEMVRWHHGSLA
jgi:aprataxin